MEVSYLISQIVVVLAMLSLGWSYFCKKKKNILIASSVSSVFYTIHYLLLSAYTGAAMNGVGILRNFLFYLHDKKTNKKSYFLLILFLVITLAFGYLLYDKWYSLLPVIAVCIFTYSVWQSNVILYKVLAIVVSIIFIAYNVLIGSIFGVISEIVLMFFELSGLKRDKKQS